MKINSLLIVLAIIGMSGCKSMQIRAEKTVREALAIQVDNYLANQKVALFLNGCAEMDKQYDVLRAELKKAIEKK